jgi:hypothetical protein
MFLTPEGNDLFLRALYRFVQFAPWRYWDPEIVASALGLLEGSVERTTSAMAVRSRQMGIAFENLFRQAPPSNYEEKLNLSKMRDLLRLATEFHPEYLRCAEHIFSNLLIVYSSLPTLQEVRQWRIVAMCSHSSNRPSSGASRVLGRRWNIPNCSST